MISNDLIAVTAFLIVVTVIVGGLFRLLRPRMRSLINTRKFSADEQLAFLEAAVMMIYADGRQELSEEIAFRSYLKHTQWGFDVDEEVERIRSRAMLALKDPEEMKVYLNQIKEKISDDRVADSILLACSDLGDYGGFTGRYGESLFMMHLANILCPDREVKI